MGSIFSHVSAHVASASLATALAALAACSVAAHAIHTAACGTVPSPHYVSFGKRCGSFKAHDADYIAGLALYSQNLNRLRSIRPVPSDSL